MTDEIKALYKQDSSTRKLSVNFPALNLTLTDKIQEESLNLKESIMSSDTLTFGACVSSQIEFKVIDVDESIKNQEFIAIHSINDIPVQIGYYIVDICHAQDGLPFKSITAYDRMKKMDVDVSSWYNGLFLTGYEEYSLSQFRTSLLTFIGIEEDISNLPLPNDDMVVKKSITPTQLSGRAVIEAIEQLNGAFGHINSDGKFSHIILEAAYIDYPKNDYPLGDYPEEEPHEQIEKSMYLEYGVKFEEYIVKSIDKLQIRQEENDVGAVVGNGNNVYVIHGNFLTYNKTTDELQTIASKASTNIFGRGYRPYTAELIGLPYIKVGDMVKYHSDDMVSGYVLTRTLTGTQVLKDVYEAPGKEEQQQNFDAGDEFIKQQGRMAKIEKSVDGIKVTVSDMEKDIYGEIDVLAGQVVLKVDTAGNIGYVELDADPDTKLTKIKLKADNIELEGYTSINNGVIITPEGLLKAVDAEFSGTITGSVINGCEIKTEGDGFIQSSDWDGTTYGQMYSEVVLKGGVFHSRMVKYYNDGTEDISQEGTIGGGVANLYKVMCNVLGDEHVGIPTAYIQQLNGGIPLTSANFTLYGISGLSGAIPPGKTIYVQNGLVTAAV